MAESYERRRPSYPPEVVAWLVDRLRIGPGATVADVGAGTGKLTRQLVPTGARVIAVEPLEEMRAELLAAVPGVEALAGSAEALPLREASADAITIASAVHWFDLDLALAEFHRVLKPGGRLAILGNARDLRQPLQAAVQEIIGRYLPDLSDLQAWRDSVGASGLFGGFEMLEASFDQLLDAEGLAERIGTISYVARLPDDERADVLARVRALGEAQPEAPFPFRYRTAASVCTRRDGNYPLPRVKAPKILAVASAVDLDFRYGCTPAWWQLWKGLHEAGCDLIVTPYRGRPVESPWWRTAPNPCYREGEAFAITRDFVARLKGDRYLRRAEKDPGDTDRFIREAVWRWVTPRWRRHLVGLLEREKDVAAVVVFTVPMSHLRGIPALLRERFGVPVVFYDGDVPMSLPEFGGMDTGFNYYFGADPAEYDLVVSNSEGGLERLRELGARRAEAIFWGADPELFQPHPVEKETDVFFYGYGDKFRREWTGAMIGEPSRMLPHVDFSIGGRDFRGDTGAARLVGDVPFNVFSRAISAARINLNVTRGAHASVYASSTSRPFELAMSGATIVSNPHAGIERWFEPGRELLVVENADQAVAAYAELLAEPGRAEELGRAARERALDEHTFLHRARRLLELLGAGVPEAVRG